MVWISDMVDSNGQGHCCVATELSQLTLFPAAMAFSSSIINWSLITQSWSCPSIPFGLYVGFTLISLGSFMKETSTMSVDDFSCLDTWSTLSIDECKNHFPKLYILYFLRNSSYYHKMKSPWVILVNNCIVYFFCLSSHLLRNFLLLLEQTWDKVKHLEMRM